MLKKDGQYITVCPRDCFGGCGLTVDIDKGQINKISGNRVNENSEGFFCPKGASYKERLKHPKRLLSPLLKKVDTFEPVAWEDAFDLIISKLDILKKNNNTEAMFYLMGYGAMGALNEYGRSFWHQYGDITSTYGSLCMSGGKKGFQTLYGEEVRQNRNEYLENTKLIIVWGSNPANTNIHRMRYIKKAIKKGAKLIVIDPRKSETMIEGCISIHPRGGTDGLLAIGVAKLLIQYDFINHSFINKYCIGFDAYLGEINKYDFDFIVNETGVSYNDIQIIAESIGQEPNYALVTGSGKSRYDNGGQTERCVSMLPALTGSIGKSNNGIYFLDSQQPKVNWHNYPKSLFSYKEKVHVGMLAYDMSNLSPRIEMLWMEKVNPIASNPDINRLKEVFSQIPFKVVVDHFLTETALEADLILPAAMFTEKNDLLTVYGDSYIQLQQKLTEPLGLCKSEVDIYRTLGERMNFDLDYLPKSDEHTINEVLKANKINTNYEDLTKKPFLFESYNSIAYEDLIFSTVSGKIELYSKQLEEQGLSPVPTYVKPSHINKTNKKYPLHLLSAHSKNMINSQFKEMKINQKESYIEVNTIDAKARGIRHNEMVYVYNEQGEISVRAHVGDTVRQGMVHMYHGCDYNGKSNINRLVKGQKTDFGDGTSFHNNCVELRKKL